MRLSQSFSDGSTRAPGTSLAPLNSGGCGSKQPSPRAVCGDPSTAYFRQKIQRKRQVRRFIFDAGAYAKRVANRDALRFAFVLACLGGCSTKPGEVDRTDLEESVAPPPGNRVEIPAIVRNNLGITFARAEARSVALTIRAPGRFEWEPHARREYRTMLGGRVELHVAQYDRIETGTLLYTLDSPQWRDLQQRLNDAESQWRQATARAESYGPLMAAHDRHHHELEQSVAIWQERSEQVQRSGPNGIFTGEEIARVRAELAKARSELAEILEKEALLTAGRIEAQAQRDASHEQFELLLVNAASLLGLPRNELTQTDPASPRGQPLWREVGRIEVRAGAPGTVEKIGLTSGAWATESSLVLTTVKIEMVRFRAMGLQSDLPRFMGAATARIVPPRTPGIDIHEAIDADLTIGLEAQPDERTVALVAIPERHRPWMRAGVSAFLEVVQESSDGPVLAIPRSAVVRDGLTHVYFRRDPAAPDTAIRVEADMGVDDGRWVVIHSGLMLGDEVVLDGVFELKLATAQSGVMQKGGHFHADGTFHADH